MGPTVVRSSALQSLYTSIPKYFFELGGAVIFISLTIFGRMVGLSWLGAALCQQGLKPQQLPETEKKQHQPLLLKLLHLARSH